MKKMFLFLFLCVFLVTQQVHAAETTKFTTTETIDYVYYDNGSYYGITEPDVHGEFWAIELIKANEMDTDIMHALNDYYKRKGVIINYKSDINAVDSEIISYKLLEQS